jgi:hypothetical protein
MSRRSHYARVHNAAARSPRGEPARPDVARPRPAAPAAADVAPQPAPPPAAIFETAPATTGTAAGSTNGHGQPLANPGSPVPRVTSNGHAAPSAEPAGCTAPQLRRFIKSRTYVPMHELRRRFGINGTEDDVTQLDMDGRHIFVGLPPREGRLLSELLRGGDVGFELSMDPQTPIVVGVYPMRPVPRN